MATENSGVKLGAVRLHRNVKGMKASGLKDGGMVRKMATGGLVDEERQKRIAQIPAGGTAPAPDGISTGNDFTRNVNNSLNALGGMGVVASVPLKAAGVAGEGLGAVRTAMNAAPVLTNNIPRLAAPVAKAAQAAPDFVAGASGVQRVGGANLPSTITNMGIPVAKATNVALQEGAKANQMAAATQSLGNASAGLGMLDQQQAPVSQVTPGNPGAPAAPSLNAPWYSPEYARAANGSDLNGLELERARRANVNPADANDPLKTMLQNGTIGTSTAQAKPTSAATNAQPALPVNARGQGYADPRQVGVGQPGTEAIDEFSNAAIAQRNPGGMVRKVVGADGRTSYSGSNVSGDVSFQGADGNALPGRPGGGFMTYGGMSPDAIKQTLTNPDGSQWSAGDNAIMAANIRDGVDKYRGTSRDPRNDPMNQPMNKSQRAAFVQREQTAMQDKRYAQANAIEQEKLGMSRAEFEAKKAKDKQLADAQAEYLAAGDDPVKLKSAERKLILIGGKQPAAVRQMVVPGGQGFDANGTPYTMPSSVYDPDTKQFIQQPQGQGAKPAQAAPQAAAISMLKANPKLAADFDAKYGSGSAKQILGQ